MNVQIYECARIFDRIDIKICPFGSYKASKMRAKTVKCYETAEDNL